MHMWPGLLHFSGMDLRLELVLLPPPRNVCILSGTQIPKVLTSYTVMPGNCKELGLFSHPGKQGLLLPSFTSGALKHKM